MHLWACFAVNILCFVQVWPLPENDSSIGQIGREVQFAAKQGASCRCKGYLYFFW